MVDQICVLDKKDKKPKCAILQSNEDATIYFMEIKSHISYMPRKKRTLNKIKTSEMTANEEKYVFTKKYSKFYTGCLY